LLCYSFFETVKYYFVCLIDHNKIQLIKYQGEKHEYEAFDVDFFIAVQAEAAG